MTAAKNPEVLAESTVLEEPENIIIPPCDDTFRTPEYYWFHPETLEYQGFRLMSSKYQAIEVTEEGWLWSEQLELFLGVRDGKLRYFTQDKQLVATPEERATVSQQQLEEERKQKQLAQQRVEELLAKLKDLGVEE